MKNLKERLTSNEIEAMIKTIKDKDASQFLKNSYTKVLVRFNIDYKNENIDITKFPKKSVNTYDFNGYEYMSDINEKAGVSFLLTGEYKLVSKAIYEKDYGVWLFYNYLGRLNISLEDCQKWLKQAQKHFMDVMPIEINLVHTPKAKDGRSFALWYATKSKSNIERKMGYEKTINFSFNDTYYYQEIGMVANGDGDNDGWGELFRERKTNLLIPQFKGTSFHFNTLIHEFAHCLDFQKQLTNKIKNYEADKKTEKSITEKSNLEKEYSKLEKTLYGEEIEIDEVGVPITNHFEFFTDSLIEILRVCANGDIPLTQKFENDAINIQTTFSGVYGDLLLEQRERKRIAKKDINKTLDMDKGKRFTLNANLLPTVKEYIQKNANNEKLKTINNKDKLSLTDSLEFDNLIKAYLEEDFKAIMVGSPNEAKKLIEPLKNIVADSNRLINNHYDNIINNYEFGFEPKSELDFYLKNNCNLKDYNNYKTWKNCSLESLKEFSR